MSYIINSPSKVLFIHIPKTAGNAIMTLANELYGTTIIKNNRTKNTNFHSTLQDAESYVQNTDNFYSFTVVRNPWSRISSWYFFRKSILAKALKNPIKQAKKVARTHSEIQQEYSLMETNFDDWLYNYLDQPWDYTWCSLAINQSHWLQSNKLQIDKIIKYEELADGFQSIPIFTGQKLNVTNRSKSSTIPYQNLYSDKSKKFVEKRYQEDIDNFKYTF